MQRILGRRVFRELKANFFRYLALFLLIVMGMYIVVATVGGAELIIYTVGQNQEKQCMEDGEFSVFVPLSQAEIAQIEEKGVTLEKAFFMDYTMEESTLRIFANRQKCNLFAVSEGRMLEKEGEILLEQHYAQAKGLTVGSVLNTGGRSFTVVGVGSTPDYDAVKSKQSDSSVDSSQFGTGFVMPEEYEKMRREERSFQAEEYCYSYRLNGCMSDEELKELIGSFEIDRSQVTDVYFLEMLEELEENRTKIEEGIEELEDGNEKLQEGLYEIAENNEELQNAADTLFDAMLEEANVGLTDAGILVTLTASDFEEKLNAMLAKPGVYSEKTKQDLQDIRESLQGIRDFKEGILEYTDGVHDASMGSGELCGGLTEIVKHNKTVNSGAEALFQGNLAQINAQLAGAGIPVALTEDKFEMQLEELIATYGAHDPQLKQTLLTAKEQLKSLASFRNGIKEYTKGVTEASLGSQQLTHGMSVLYTAGEPLKEGTDELFDGILEMVTEQLNEKKLEVNLTEDNFEQELDRLTKADSLIDKKLKESLKDTRETLLDLKDFKDGIVEYTDAVQEAAEGSKELLDGVSELQEEAEEMLDKYFTIDIDNLTSFIPQKDNPRINASVNDVMINKYAGLAAGVIVMILFTYVISVFVVHNIEQESSIIGALYALGVDRRELVLHYLVLPVVITFLGGAAGCLIGFSPLGVDDQIKSTVTYFSLPPVQRVFPVYLLVYCFIMPPVAAMVVNVLVISRKLKRSPLSLIRGEKKAGKIREMNLGGLNFTKRFQIRQTLREMRSAAAVIGGMFICLLVLMIGINCYVLCVNYTEACDRETTYEYMYSYKYPVKEVPEGGTEGYLEGLSKTAFGYNLEIMVLGLTEENPYFQVSLSNKQNEMVISSAVATKFGVKAGEKLVLTDEVNNKDYAFTIVDVVSYDSALYGFMDIEAMRKLFGRDEDYINVVFADEALDIPGGRLYATTTRTMIAEASEIFVEMMWPMVIMLGIVSIIIFMVVMYLMMKVTIDRSAFPIALMKVFGYRNKEVKKLYLDGNFFLVALGALVCLPASKLTMDGIYPYFISNIGIGMNLRFDWKMYVGIYVCILLFYLIVNRLLVGRIRKVNLAEVLKNRE